MLLLLNKFRAGKHMGEMRRKKNWPKKLQTDQESCFMLHINLFGGSKTTTISSNIINNSSSNSSNNNNF